MYHVDITQHFALLSLLDMISVSTFDGKHHTEGETHRSETLTGSLQDLLQISLDCLIRKDGNLSSIYVFWEPEPCNECILYVLYTYIYTHMKTMTYRSAFSRFLIQHMWKRQKQPWITWFQYRVVIFCLVKRKPFWLTS